MADTIYPHHITKDLSHSTPGVVQEAWWAPKDWFLTIAKPSGPFNRWRDHVLITQDHTFKTSTPALGFIRIELTDRTSEVKFTETGELDSKGTNAEFEGFAPGMNLELFGMFGRTLDGIWLIHDLNCN